MICIKAPACPGSGDFFFFINQFITWSLSHLVTASTFSSLFTVLCMAISTRQLYQLALPRWQTQPASNSENSATASASRPTLAEVNKALPPTPAGPRPISKDPVPGPYQTPLGPATFHVPYKQAMANSANKQSGSTSCASARLIWASIVFARSITFFFAKVTCYV